MWEHIIHIDMRAAVLVYFDYYNDILLVLYYAEIKINWLLFLVIIVLCSHAQNRH